MPGITYKQFLLGMLASVQIAGVGAAATRIAGAVAGYVTVARDRQPVAGADVSVAQTGMRATTSEDGSYSFPDLAPGIYTLVVKLPGARQTVQTTVTVAAGATTRQNIPVGQTASALETITVMGQRTPRTVARQAQKEAPNLVNITTYQEIRKLPDISVSEAVRRVPGISLETDEGEGRYVNIRGLDADLNSTTFGGLRLPPTNNASPFGGYRAVTMDSIPIGLVGAITVTKSNLPSQDAEALGGTIEITPKTVPAGAKTFLQGNIGSGYEPLRNTGIVDFSITAGTHLGNGYGNGPFSILVTDTYYEDHRGIDDVEPAYFNDSSHPYLAVSNIQQRDYELNRKRHAYGIDLGYQPDEDDSYYVRAFEAGYTEYYERQYTNITPDGNTTVNADGSISDTLNSSGAIQKSLRDEKEKSLDRIVTAGGKNAIGADTLDYHVGFTLGTYHKPYDYNSTYTYSDTSGGNTTIDYNNSGPGHVPSYRISGANYQDASKYTLTGFSNSTQDNYDREYSGAFNLNHPAQWVDQLTGIATDSESLKFGGSLRLRHKHESASPTSYSNLGNISLTTGSFGGNETYYDGLYKNGVDITPGYLQHLYGTGTAAQSDIVSSASQYLDDTENVFAGYVQYQATMGRLGLTGGVRVERTVDNNHAFETSSTSDSYSPVTAHKSYTNVFPGLQAKFAIAPDLLLRAAWSSTIARPGFNQSTPSLYVDFGSSKVSTGNPNLKPATANSFDVDVEKYLSAAGIASFGFFDKEIANYIVSRSTGSITVSGTTLPLYTYANAASSYARGLEFNLEQRFWFLPGILRGMGVSGNYTYADSRFEIRPGEYNALPSTSKNTWNADLFYEDNGISLRLGAYYAGADLFSIGSDKTSDVYNASRLSLDFGSSYALNANLTLYFNAKNLLNTPHAFYEGTSNRPIQREFYSQTYQSGIRFDY